MDYFAHMKPFILFGSSIMIIVILISAVAFINNKNEAEVSKSKMSQINYLTLIILLIGGSMLFVMAYYLYYLFV